MLFWGALIHAATQMLEMEWMWRCSIFPNLKKDTYVVQLGSMTAVCENEPKQAFILLGWVPTPEKTVQYRLQVWDSHGKYTTLYWLLNLHNLTGLDASDSLPAWADLTPSDYSIDIPQSKCSKASVEVYLEQLLHVINYWISILISETLSHWNVGTKGKYKVTVWQFDLSHNRRSQKRTLAKIPSDRDVSLSNWVFHQPGIYRHSSISWRGKKKLYKCNQFQVLKVLVYYLLVSELLLKCIFKFFDQLMASTRFLST